MNIPCIDRFTMLRMGKLYVQRNSFCFLPHVEEEKGYILKLLDDTKRPTYPNFVRW